MQAYILIVTLSLYKHQNSHFNNSKTLELFFSHKSHCVFYLKMVSSQTNVHGDELTSKKVVSDLYKALATRDIDTVHRLVTPDLEWWFHGPPSCQHMMLLLTGTGHDSFVFEPLSIFAFGSMVFVEGYDDEMRCEFSWVHVWTVTDGIITQVREYFNTGVTVTCFGKHRLPTVSGESVWKSWLSDSTAVPGLVLAL